MSAFLIVLAAVYLVLGPDMLLLFQTGARRGRRATLVAALGLAPARAYLPYTSPSPRDS